MSRRIVGHLDADCFYVSCERVRHPHLRHLPVGVLGNQGAVVIAKSYELKRAGVQTGMVIWDAVRLCPEAIFLKRDFRWYEMLSRKMLTLLQEVSPQVEYYSIDEMFFDAGWLSQNFGRPLAEAAVLLQRRMLDDVGVPTSLGISRSRTLAKLASDARKPFGCTVLLDPGEIRAFLANLPVEELSGIAEKSRVKLAAHGIRTCLDLADADRHLVRRLLTIKGEALWWELRGEAVNPIRTHQPSRQRIGRGGSLGGATRDLERLTGWVVRNVERLVEELDHHQVDAGQLSLWLESRGAVAWGRRVLFPQPTSSFHRLAAAAKRMLASAHGGRLISGMHLEAERLSRRAGAQRALFPDVSHPTDRIAAVKRAANAKFGRFALRSGDTLAINDIYADPAQAFDICDIHGKTCF
jgi:nucleotidyltransferase/DNA polymerase involved in DNA repair